MATRAGETPTTLVFAFTPVPVPASLQLMDNLQVGDRQVLVQLK